MEHDFVKWPFIIECTIGKCAYAGDSLDALLRGVCTRTEGLLDGASRCVTLRVLTVRTGDREAERSLRGDKLLVTRRPRRS